MLKTFSVESRKVRDAEVLNESKRLVSLVHAHARPGWCLCTIHLRSEAIARRQLITCAADCCFAFRTAADLSRSAAVSNGIDVTFSVNSIESDITDRAGST